MTELYIAGQLVVLPESFSITIIEENPFFTKNGKYSYDITLSLLDPINARIYKHLNRVNNKAVLPKNRTAYLVVDNEVVLNGTEVILEHTDKEVKIQLLSGNSELNFLIGGDRKLRDLNLGKAEKYTGASWMEVAKKVYLDLDKVYPERNWILAPYTAGYDTGIANDTLLKVGNFFSLPNKTQMPGIEQGSRAFPQYEPSYSGHVPQPYLCYIIRKVIEALGYTLEYNALEYDEERSQSYIVHGFRTSLFSQMLPNWTVLEFFENLETWMDATTVINPYTKSVRIDFNYKDSVDPQSQQIQIETIEVLDEYNVEYDEDNEPRLQTSNVAYDLDDDEYYMYMCIENRIRKTNMRMAIDSLSTLRNMVEANPHDQLLFDYIYKIIGTDDEYIAFRIKNDITIKKIDSFKPLYDAKEKKEDIDIQLKIVPASFVYTALKTASGHSPFPGSVFWVQVAVAEDYDDLSSGGAINDGNDGEEETEYIGDIQEAIENGTGDVEEKGGSRMRLALYTGSKFMNRKSLNPDSGIHSAYYPMPYVESLYEDFPESKEERYMHGRRSGANPFRLEEMKKDIYSKAQAITTTEIHKFSFIHRGKQNITSVFVANNKKYKCVKIERIVTEQGFDEVAKAEFYPYS